MALTITIKDRNVFGASHAVIAELTGDSSYPTGGYAVTPALLGLTQHGAASVIILALFDGTASATLGYRAVYDYANQKVMFLRTDQVDDPQEEVPNGTSVTGAIFRALFLTDNPNV